MRREAYLRELYFIPLCNSPFLLFCITHVFSGCRTVVLTKSLWLLLCICILEVFIISYHIPSKLFKLKFTVQSNFEVTIKYVLNE